MALHPDEDVRPTAERLLDHHADEVREAAAKAIAFLNGASDPVRFVLRRLNTGTRFDALTNEQRVVYLAWLFDAEVCNGGLMQFFGNSGGDRTPETLLALEKLAHAEGERAIREAIRKVGPLAREVDRELRLTAFESRFDELRAAFEPLESAYYKTAANLRRAWSPYAARHAEHFRD